MDTTNKNWRVNVYNGLNDIVETWVIKNRNEKEAYREAEADVGRCEVQADWTLEAID